GKPKGDGSRLEDGRAGDGLEGSTPSPSAMDEVSDSELRSEQAPLVRSTPPFVFAVSTLAAITDLFSEQPAASAPFESDGPAQAARALGSADPPVLGVRVRAADYAGGRCRTGRHASSGSGGFEKRVGAYSIPYQHVFDWLQHWAHTCNHLVRSLKTC